MRITNKEFMIKKEAGDNYIVFCAGSKASCAKMIADVMELKWYSEGSPYSSGIDIFCTEEEAEKVRAFARENGY